MTIGARVEGPDEVEPLIERVAARADAVAERIMATLGGEVSFFAGLPASEHTRVLHLYRDHVRFFLGGVPDRRLPTDDDLLPIHLGAARRAEEGVPLEALLSSYQVGVAVMWDVLREEATEAEQTELVALVSWLLAYLNALVLTGAGAYVEERERIYGDERHAQRVAAEALLEGTLGPAAAGRTGQRLAPGYVVLAVRFDEPESTDRAAAAVTARRRVHRLEAALDDRYGPGVLSLLKSAGGTVLLPAGGSDSGAELADRAELSRLLVDIAGPATSAAVAWRPGIGGVAAAGREANDVLRIAAALGRPPGLQRLEDVLFEYVISGHPDPTACLLERVVDPLTDGPDLLATLEQWFDADFDRRRTAAALHVHPNTLDYRLQRVHVLTGVDPASARGVQLLGAAMVARRLARTPGAL